MKSKSKSSLKSKLSKNGTINKLLNNNIVLYLVGFIALIDILGYLFRYDFSAIIFFCLVATIVHYYTNNMIIVLGSAVIATTILHSIRFSINKFNNVKEGMKNGMKDKKPEHDSPHDEKEHPNKEHPNKDDPNKKHPNKKHPNKKHLKKDEEDSDDNNDDDDDNDDDGDNNGNGDDDDNDEAFNNKLPMNPKELNIPNVEQLKSQLGEADKIENAYDQLEKIIGQDGIKSMSKETKDLVKQQKKLLEGLKDVTPALNVAMDAVSKIDLNKLMDNFKNK